MCQTPPPRIEYLLNTDTLSSNLHRRQLPADFTPKITVPTLRTNDQTTALLRAFVDSLDNIDQLLLVLQHPVQLVVITRSKITHHMLIAIEEHDRHRIVELIHRAEIGDLVEVAKVDDGEVCAVD